MDAVPVVDIPQIKNRKSKIQNYYIHIPFCEKKCVYCNFASIAKHSDLHFPYFNALKKEIKSFISNIQVKNSGYISSTSLPPNLPTSLYFGGGTPSCVNVDFLIEIIEIFKSIKNSQSEISVECNPHSLSIEFAEKLHKSGVNRFSLGVQSLNNSELEKLGRLHDANLARKAFKLLQKAGCKNISVDLMFGIPGQSKKSWEKTLIEVAEEWKPEHISFYSLSIEPGTPFAKWRETKSWRWPTDEETMDFYWLGNKLLSKYGYARYEISNFSKPGFESEHNSVYWDTNKSYVGFGAAAHSFYAFPSRQKRRFRNIKDVKEYIKRVDAGDNFRTFSRKLNVREKAGEEIFLGLRRSKGVKLKETHLKYFGKNIKQQIADGLVKYLDDKTIALTNRGIEIANVVMSEYV